MDKTFRVISFFSTMASLTRVFVYGTLKKGFPNHRLLSEASKYGHVAFLGEFLSSEKYPLVVTSRAFVPFMLDNPGTGHNIKGEVYEVCEKTLAKLDELEANGILYDRRPISVILADKNANDDCIQANAYLITNHRENLLDLPMVSNYTKDLSKMYKPQSERDDDYLEQIIRLVKNEKN